MPIAVICPGCDARLNAPDATAGKTVKCPKCKEPMVIPEAEEVDETPVPKKTNPVKKTIVVDDDDEDEKPRRKKSSRDDDEDDRPKNKKGKKKKQKPGMQPAVLISLIVGGVLLLGGGAFGVYWFAIREDKPKETASNTNPMPGGPMPGGPMPGGPGMPGGPRPEGGVPTGPGGGVPVQPGAPVKALYDSPAPAQRQLSNNNLKQIGLAFHNFAGANTDAIPAGIYDSTGKIGLSWRVAILPYIEQDSLYKQFHLNEPWDSEHNKKLIPLMPRTYLAPGATNNGLTYYRSFTGPDTVFPPVAAGQPGKPAMGMNIGRIPDGTSNTIWVAEAGDAVEWTKPDELVYAAASPLPRVGGIFGTGYHVSFADGSTRFMKTTTPANTLKALITAKGGEIVELE